MLPQLVAIYEHIESNMGKYYSQYKLSNGQNNTRFGGVSGITPSNKTQQYTSFTRQPIDYGVASGYVFPIFASLRALLKYVAADNTFRWQTDDVPKFLDIVGPQLAEKAFESHGNNANKTGKDPQVYKDMYRIVELAMFKNLSHV